MTLCERCLLHRMDEHEKCNETIPVHKSLGLIVPWKHDREETCTYASSSRAINKWNSIKCVYWTISFLQGISLREEMHSGRWQLCSDCNAERASGGGYWTGGRRSGAGGQWSRGERPRAGGATRFAAADSLPPLGSLLPRNSSSSSLATASHHHNIPSPSGIYLLGDQSLFCICYNLRVRRSAYLEMCGRKMRE